MHADFAQPRLNFQSVIFIAEIGKVRRHGSAAVILRRHPDEGAGEVAMFAPAALVGQNRGIKDRSDRVPLPFL